MVIFFFSKHKLTKQTFNLERPMIARFSTHPIVNTFDITVNNQYNKKHNKQRNVPVVQRNTKTYEFGA